MASPGVNCLKDIDWSVRLALASDKLSVLREGILLLKLSTVSDEIIEDVLIEFNTEEIETFLILLKAAREATRSHAEMSDDTIR